MATPAQSDPYAEFKEPLAAASTAPAAPAAPPDPYAEFKTPSSGFGGQAAPPTPAAQDPYAEFKQPSSSIFQTTPQEPPRGPEGTHSGDPLWKRAWDWTNTPIIDSDLFKSWTGWDAAKSIAGIQNPWLRGGARLAEGFTSPLNLGLMAASLGGSTLLESGGSAALKLAGFGVEDIATITRGAEIFGNAEKVGKTATEALRDVEAAGLSTRTVTDGLQALAKSNIDKSALLSHGIIRRIASSGLRSDIKATPENIAVAENIGKWGQVALDAGFSAQLAYGGAQYSSALFDAIKDKEWDRAKELAVELAGTGYFAVATGRAALHEAGYQSTPGAKFGKD